MSFSLALETPLQDEVRDLVVALNEYLQPLSPPEYQFQMTVEQMAGPDTHLFVARDENGQAVGMGALRVHEDGLGEIKRMFSVPAVRGKRVGRLILDALEAHAKKMDLTMLKLETGDVAGFEGAFRLYERSGFTRCEAFLDYPSSEYSTFFEKPLVSERATA